MRIDEINTRLAEIDGMLDGATAEQLAEFETEVKDLKAARAKLEAEVQTRQQLRADIAAGKVTGKIIEKKEEDKNMVDTPEYREAYLLNLQGRALNEEQRAAVTASAAIPTQTLNKIEAYIEQSPILSRVDMTYIPGNVTIPVEDANADAAWVAMGTAATDSADGITSISLAAYKLIKTVEITADVEAMAIDAFEAWLVGSLGRKIEKALNSAVFNGTGTNQPTGICTTVTATGSFTKAKATYADIIGIIAALDSAAAQNAVFAMPRKLFFTDVLGIEDSTKKPICHLDLESPAKYNILGYPVVLDDTVPADNMLFGDFKMYKLNIAQAPTVKSDDSVGFRSGSRVYRAMALADGKLAMSKAFVRYNRANS